MACYIVPAVAAIVHFFFRRNVSSWGKSKHHSWLNLLFAGGAIFGIIDHWWNGELFLLGAKPIEDIMLGVTITVVILLVWGAMIVVDKVTAKETVKA